MSFANLPKNPAPSLDELKAQMKAAGAKPATAPAVAPAVRPAAKAKPAPVVEPEPVVVEAVAANGDPEPVETRAVSVAEQSFLAQITGTAQGDTAAALMAAHEAGDSGGSRLLFPTITQASGPAGGAFQRVGNNTGPHANADVPEGKTPFLAVFMGYRYTGAVWPDNGGAGTQAPRPEASFAVPTSRPDVVAKLMAAGKAFQFSRKRDSHAVSAGGPGVVKPSLELMLYDPDADLVFVYRTPGHYSSAQALKDQLLATAQKDAQGNLAVRPFFAQFSPKTEKRTRDGSPHAIVWHYPEIQVVGNGDARAQAAVLAYKKFLASAGPDVTAAGGEWFVGADQPITQADIDRLDNAIAIG